MERSNTVVVISRYWDNPMITVVIDDEKIEVKMPVQDFLKAIVAEIPHPSATMTRSKLEAQVLKVLPVVLNKVKEATAQV
jgi:hypothetical protein